jgi:hypothetical protein
MLAKQGRDLTSLRRIFCIGGILMLLVSLSAYREGILRVIVMAVLSAVSLGVFFLVLMCIERERRDSVAELETQMPDQ